MKQHSVSPKAEALKSHKSGLLSSTATYYLDSILEPQLLSQKKKYQLPRLVSHLTEFIQSEKYPKLCAAHRRYKCWISVNNNEDSVVVLNPDEIYFLGTDILPYYICILLIQPQVRVDLKTEKPTPHFLSRKLNCGIDGPTFMSALLSCRLSTQRISQMTPEAFILLRLECHREVSFGAHNISRNSILLQEYLSSHCLPCILLTLKPAKHSLLTLNISMKRIRICIF